MPCCCKNWNKSFQTWIKWISRLGRRVRPDIAGTYGFQPHHWQNYRNSQYTTWCLLVLPDVSSFYKDDLVDNGCSDEIVFNITPNVEDREGRDDLQSTNQLNNVAQDLSLEQQHDVQKPQQLFDDPDIFKTPFNSPSGLLFLSVITNSLAKALTGPDKVRQDQIHESKGFNETRK